jgi:predicted lactoylglutathione lyase
MMMTGGKFETAGILIGSVVAGVDANSVFYFIGTATFLLVAANQLRQFRSRGIVEVKDPVSVKTAIRTATHEELKELEAESQANHAEIKQMVKELGDKLDRYSTSAYQARKAMHKDIGNHAQALAFLAGTLTAMGDKESAERVRKMVEAG